MVDSVVAAALPAEPGGMFSAILAGNQEVQFVASRMGVAVDGGWGRGFKLAVRRFRLGSTRTTRAAAAD